MKSARVTKSLGLVVPLLAGFLVSCERANDGSHDPSARSACRAGTSPTHAYHERPEEEGLRYGTRPIVIGCAALPSGRTFELVGYQLGRGARTELCIDHYDAATGETWGCGSNTVLGGRHIDASATHRTSGQPDVVAGALSARAARVTVRSEIGGRIRPQAAVLIAVRDRALLRAIGVESPFGRYFAEMPRNARGVTAQALDSSGRHLGLAFAEGVRDPIGSGQACYSRPRITGLRLLDDPRGGERNRLRVVVRYPAGHLRSVEATVGGDETFRARPRARGQQRPRYRLTLPLVLPQSGTIGIDVAADGRPRAKRCGRRAVPRRSAVRTLVVRVRGRA